MSLAFSCLTDDYITHLRVERGLSPNTCQTYGSWLRHYRHWLVSTCHTQDDLSVFTTPVLRTYLYALSTRNLRPRSIRVVDSQRLVMIESKGG